MSENITIDLEGLSKEEREQLLRLVEKAKKPKKIWKPKCGEKYWYITLVGVSEETWNGSGDGFDLGAYELGNCFRTKEEAEFAREKQKIKVGLQRFADEHNDPEKLGWNGINEHCSIRYNYWTNDLVTSCMQQSKDIDCIYFSSKEIADAAIETIGKERILKYMFDIETKENEQ